MYSKSFFGKRVKELRQTKSLTQQQLGVELGTVKQTVNNWETLYRSPPLEMLVAIADYFDVSLDYLVGRSDNPDRL